MSKKNFHVNSWLRQSPDLPPPLPEEIRQNSYTNPNFQLGGFLIPGWKGESLFSKNALKIKKLQEKLILDSITQLKGLHSINPSLRKGIHEEFKLYLTTLKTSKYKDLSFRTDQDFWNEILNKNSEYQKFLNKFLKAYSFRVSTIYLYKIKFILTLAETLGFTFDHTLFRSPNNFIQRVFQGGSHYEINCESLQPNTYSWFRPSESLISDLFESKNLFQELTTSQMMKLSCFSDNSKNKIEFEDNEYSHALSHKAFGLFINTLLVYLPIWTKKEAFTYPQPFKKFPTVLNTKFCGKKLRSLCHSHWLAQSTNASFKWSEVLCPEFCSDKFSNGAFTKSCHELQFLTFLTQFAKSQGYEPKEFISYIVKSKYLKSKTDDSLSFFSSKYEFKKEVAFDRIVINATQLEKKNPHHQLIQKITTESKNLASNGIICVLTNQKLFIPSQSSRVEQFLKDFNIQASFEFDKLNGKGEVAQYTYLITKRKILLEKKDIFNIAPSNLHLEKEKESDSIFTFRFTGELKQFSQFDLITKELELFFRSKSSFQSSIYQKEISQDLSYEFHQDAIVEGKLLSSLTKDRSNITHPNFFKNLADSCLPLDSFFNIKLLEDNSSELRSTSNLLGIKSERNDQFHHVLVVDHRNPTNILLDIISSSSYQAAKQNLGTAFYSYFGLTAKVKNLNLNLFREFFESTIGEQVIQLCLSSGVNKLRSKISSLLIPSFFKDVYSGDIDSSISPLFKSSQNEILKLHPEEIEKQFKDQMIFLNSFSNESPWLVLSILCQFKNTVENIISSFDNISNVLDFTNPLISHELVCLETTPLFPQNDDIYLDLKAQKAKDLKLPLKKVVLNKNIDGHWVELYNSSNSLICNLHGEKYLCSFLEFILKNAIDMPIDHILQNLNIPSAKEVDNVINDFSKLSSTLTSIVESSYQSIQGILSKQFI